MADRGVPVGPDGDIFFDPKHHNHHHEEHAEGDFEYLVNLKARTASSSQPCSPHCLDEYICGITSLPSPDEWEWFKNSDLEHTKQNEIARFAASERATLSPVLQKPATQDGVLTRMDLTPENLPSLLQLPGEVRMKIYSYLWNSYRVSIERNTSISPRFKLTYNELGKRDPNTHQLYHGTSCRDLFTTGLIFTCKGIYRETLQLLYSNTHFVFCTIHSARRFLETVTPDAKAAIKHLGLRNTTYNEPFLNEHRPFKRRSDLAWSKVCERFARDLTALQTLDLEATILGWPLPLRVDGSWSRPYMHFCGFRETGRLTWVSVKLRLTNAVTLDPVPSYEAHPSLLPQIATELESRLMTKEAFQIRQDALLAEKLQTEEPPLKARKVLRLVIPPTIRHSTERPSV
ncbi:hypothetical protein N7474_003048 [Penicillium riverlandense]|uniref:uncharacterized protein n=1 Tax=Penicillium riverlandense TaxID=1903569 RepID=UPI00254850B6|nr:uncharacterized protein N7474_003048 [Penicillium riverlandense]KAJ5825910.1 hypothetical protein N7474_003048 [Penicillium riverlandense]